MKKSTVDLFFQVLRLSLGVSDDQPDNMTEEGWKALYEIARQQSLLGVLFYGIQRNAVAKPERKLLLKWYAVSEKIRQANQKTNETAVALSAFFRQEGFRTCILKGQGNTLNYPAPFVRTSGDIDVWVEGNPKAVLAFARRHFVCSKACYHHVDAGMFRGIEVEVHYRPSFMNNLLHNRRMQRWFAEMAEEQFCHEVELPDGVGRVCVPTPRFNRIYQMAHICNHVIHEGIGLRQLVDYYYVLRQGFTEEERAEDAAVLRRLGLYRVAAAVMYVLQEVLHLEREQMIVPADERLGAFLLEEILASGNFGQYDQRVARPKHGLAQNWQRLRRDMRLLRYFPSECLWEPVFRWYHFFWRLKHRGSSQ